MSDITIKKSKLDIGEYEAFMEYIAICDHPEIMDEDIEEVEE